MTHFEGKLHFMNGPHFQFIGEKSGSMFCRDMCDCGCIDKKWKIEEYDTIIAFRPSLWGNLKNLKVIALEFKIYKPTALENCRLVSRDFNKYPL